CRFCYVLPQNASAFAQHLLLSYSIEILPLRITSPQVLVSSETNLANSSGVFFSAIAPKLSSCAITSGLARIFSTVALILSMIGLCVPLGASRPNHEGTLGWRYPGSLSVGTSGNASVLLSVVTAQALFLPALICGTAAGIFSKTTSV